MVYLLTFLMFLLARLEIREGRAVLQLAGVAVRVGVAPHPLLPLLPRPLLAPPASLDQLHTRLATNTAKIWNWLSCVY